MGEPEDLTEREMAAALARIVGALSGGRASVQGIAEAARRSTFIDRLWELPGTRRCCRGVHPLDGIVLWTPSATRKELLVRDGAEAGFRPLFLCAVDGARGAATTIFVDVEDAKALVNALMEAVAHIESIG